jgi:RNA polymerase sigma-32 factor
VAFPRTPTRTCSTPDLDSRRERELLARVRSAASAADRRAALTELWMSHAKLVAAIAARYRRSGIDLDDLVNAGHLGLHAAIMRFDANRFDSRLAAYASHWIRWFIADHIRRDAGPVRLPESKAYRQLAQSAARLIAEARKACAREGVDAGDTELHERIGRRVGLSADEVARGLRLIHGARVSLYTDDADGEHETDLPDENASTAEDMNDRLDNDRLRERIHVLANEVLGAREREVFFARPMADSNAVPSLETLAAKLGVSVPRIRQIEVSARRKIAVALVTAGYCARGCVGDVAHLSEVRSGRHARPDTRPIGETPSK